MVKFCASCGTPLEWREFEQKQRPYCSQCQQIYYAQLKVGAGGLIEQDGRLLLLQRTHTPFELCWNLPAGYAESNESPHQTVVREVYEETGLHVEVERLTDVYFFADDPRGNGILIVYKCRCVGGELTATAEAANPTFFAASDIPRNLAGGGHDQAILAWQSSRCA
jgi:ADP-ribose pyrophosphatase YjhB (NUDIX family)